MLNYCPSTANENACGASYKGWMSGSLPSQYEGEVIRRVYFAYSGDCYYFSVGIKVRNCGSFYVYYLTGALIHDCFRYCGMARNISSSVDVLPSTSFHLLPTPTPVVVCNSLQSILICFFLSLAHIRLNSLSIFTDMVKICIFIITLANLFFYSGIFLSV